MNERRNVIFSAIILFLPVVILFPACKNVKDRSQEQKTAMRREIPPVDAASQEAFKKKLAGLGVPLYKKAAFVEIKRSSIDSPLLYAVYEVPDERGRAYDEVKAFYTRKLKETLVPRGWVTDRSTENIIAYRKGFEIFYIELALVIVMPDTKKIRIAVYYGQ